MECLFCGVEIGPTDWTGLCPTHRGNREAYTLARPRPLCVFPSCEAELYRSNQTGLCRPHANRYNAWRYNHEGAKVGDYLAIHGRLCDFEGCSVSVNQYSWSGMCKAHVRIVHNQVPEVRNLLASQNLARKARRRDAFVEHVDRSILWARDDGVCHLCGEPANEADWHVDHVHPLSLGGEHSYANTAVSHPSCNQAKGNRVLVSWATETRAPLGQVRSVRSSSG